MRRTRSNVPPPRSSTPCDSEIAAPASRWITLRGRRASVSRVYRVRPPNRTRRSDREARARPLVAGCSERRLWSCRAGGRFHRDGRLCAAFRRRSLSRCELGERRVRFGRVGQWQLSGDSRGRLRVPGSGVRRRLQLRRLLHWQGYDDVPAGFPLGTFAAHSPTGVRCRRARALAHDRDSADESRRASHSRPAQLRSLRHAARRLIRRSECGLCRLLVAARQRVQVQFERDLRADERASRHADRAVVERGQRRDRRHPQRRGHELILVPGNGWTGAHSWTQNWYGSSNAVGDARNFRPG